MDSSIQFAVSIKHQTSIINDGSERSAGFCHGMKIFPPAPAIDSETGHRILCVDEDIWPKSY